MVVCGACGEENPERAKYCLNCAAPLTTAAPTRDVRKTVTVLFADVSDSTARGEQLDPESVRALMSRYFAEMGAIVCPPVPAFYNRPATIDAMVDQTVGRLLDLLGIDPGEALAPRWSGPDRG